MTPASSWREFKKQQARQLCAGSSFAVLTLALASGTPTVVHAQDASNLTQVMETVQKLEARVATLEGDYKRARQDAAQARSELQALRRKVAVAPAEANKPGAIVTATASAKTALPPITDASTGLYSAATKAPRIGIDPGWAGFYAGAAFGPDYMHARTNASGIQNLSTSSTSPGFDEVTTGTTTDTFSFTGQTVGAVSSMSLGYNYMVDSKNIIGVQAEGGLADTFVNLKGSGSSTGVSTNVNTPPGGAAGTSVTTTTTISNGAVDAIENRWLVSFLLRGGKLVDANDFIYLLGGYTYGRFETDGGSIGLSGGTVGAGWERQIWPSWTLRAEYRYTRFQNADIHSGNQAPTNETATNGVTFTTNSTNIGDYHISDLDMHSVWIGLSHYFGNY